MRRTSVLGPVLVSAALALAACSASGADPAPSCDAQCESNIAAAMTTHVTYLLTGHAPAGANITYILGDGGQEQQNGLAVPMMNKKTGKPGISFDASGGFLYFSAQNQGSGSLTCEIVEDGTVLTKHTSTGAYAIVTCEADA